MLGLLYAALLLPILDSLLLLPFWSRVLVAVALLAPMNVLTVRLTLRKPGPGGRVFTRSVETSINPRN